MTATLEELRYPVGKFEAPDPIAPHHLEAWISEIDAFPAKFRAAVEPLSPSQLDTPYRPGGWTVRQVAHHLADSHMNSVLRFKWALTEDRPTIKPYFEDRWATLADTRDVPVGVALDLLTALHRRWVGLLRGMTPEDFRRELMHPESGILRLDRITGLYAWHGRHHLAHVTRLAEREHWTRAS